jgi:hypothetical protein
LWNREVEILEDRHSRTGRVCEADVLELDIATGADDLVSLGRADGRVTVLELEQTSGGTDTLHQLAVEAAQAEQAAAGVRGVHQEASQFAD